MPADPRVYIRANLRHNLVVNLLDGGFFGFALGFASFVTVLPLFVSQMTDSAVLIGLIPAIHAMGWQFPQLFTAKRVARQRRYIPMVLLMTIHERIPFIGLIFVALLRPVLGNGLALALTFLMLIWQGLGGGFTATAWQAMIAKIIPGERRATFYGAQSATANALSSLTAVLAGVILYRFDSPLDFALCFFMAVLGMAISFYFLSRTREPESEPAGAPESQRAFWRGLGAILQKDANFRSFLSVRMLSQVAIMAFAFYTVYAVNHLGMSEVAVGWLTFLLMSVQIVANPIMGWLGDRWSHRAVMQAGLLSASASALLAWWAPHTNWFFPVYLLAGIANVAIWTIGLAMILEFGQEAERPAYIGLANTLVAPATILAPFLGGWLANLGGYPAAFLTSAAGGLACVVILQFLVRDPRKLPGRFPVTPAPIPEPDLNTTDRSSL